MVIIHAEFTIKKEHRETFLGKVSSWVEASLAEQGVVSYRAYQALNNPNTFIFVEVYANKAALDTHGKTTHVQEMHPTIGGMLEGEANVQVYDHTELA